MSIVIVVKTRGQVPVLEVAGKISDVEVDQFSAEVQKLRDGSYPKVILDISKVNFLDSQGLGKIVAFGAAMRKDQRELVIVNSNPDPDSFVPGLFAMTNLDKVIKVVDSIELA
jgi:anti-sigma B factor antagonist